MISDNTRIRLIRILLASGLLIAILSALENRIDWLSAFCGFFGDGCKETVQYTMFSISLSYWGIAFYLSAIILTFIRKIWTDWLIMAGAGMEITLVSIMLNQSMACVFCILNLGIIILLVVISFEKSKFWQAAAISLFLFIVTDALVSGGNHNPVSERPYPEVIARVGNKDITLEEIKDPIAGKMYKLERQLHDLKAEHLETTITNMLLDLDAEEKGISSETLIIRILSGIPGVTDADVLQYYNDNRKRLTHWDGSEAELKNKIRTFLVGRKRDQAMDSYTEPLRKRYNVSVFLSPPPLPMASVNTKNNYSTGPADAPVTVVEFSDYLCPSCRRNHSITKDIKAAFNDKIRWTFKDYPLKRHKGAKLMAVSARCAGVQGKFWEYQDLMFEAEGKQEKPDLISAAASLGLDTDQYSECLDDPSFLAAVESDIRDAKEAGISSTPSFIINGKLHPGSLSEKKFRKLINEALKTSNH